MKNNYVKNIVLATVLLLAGSSYQSNFSKDHNPDKLLANRLEKIVERDNKFKKRMKEQSSDEINPPYYKLKPNRCSEYAAKSAKKLYEKYSIGNCAVISWKLISK